jgi:hypothetical protein
MSKVVIKKGSWGMYEAEIDGELTGYQDIDEHQVLRDALVRLGAELEYEIDGRPFVVDRYGYLQRKKETV